MSLQKKNRKKLKINSKKKNRGDSIPWRMPTNEIHNTESKPVPSKNKVRLLRASYALTPTTMGLRWHRGAWAGVPLPGAVLAGRAVGQEDGGAGLFSSLREEGSGGRSSGRGPETH